MLQENIIVVGRKAEAQPASVAISASVGTGDLEVTPRLVSFEKVVH